ncbi:MAG: hypothetical protein WC788_06060 [Candidatus Paceibacterota bacterium]|jgi:hypothetical protein
MLLGLELIVLSIFSVPGINLDQAIRPVLVVMGAGFGLSGSFIIMRQGVSTETLGRVKELQKLSMNERLDIITEKMQLEKFLSIGLIISLIGMFVQFMHVAVGLMIITAGMLTVILYSGHYMRKTTIKT